MVGPTLNWIFTRLQIFRISQGHPGNLWPVPVTFSF